MAAVTPPVVTMLWEAADPSIVLARRFALAGREEAARWLRTTVAEHWGIDVHACERIVLSATNALAWLDTGEGPFLAKWSVAAHLHPRLAELARLTAWLHDRGLPVSRPVPLLDGSLQVALPGASLGLQAAIAGDLLDPTDPGQVRQAGDVLARLHLAMAEYPRADLVGNRPFLSPPSSLGERIAGWLDSARDHGHRRVEQFVRDRLAGLTEESLPPRQLVHNDFRSANVICAAGQIVAVLDFEEVARDQCVADLAYGAVMVGTRFRNWKPVPAETHRLLLDGYRHVRPLSDSEEAWLPVLMTFQTLRFVPTGHDPGGWGESAEQSLTARAVELPSSG
ncbi:MAG: phosphotransferase enzyme family protein [Acidimicrobiales bacterium]